MKTTKTTDAFQQWARASDSPMFMKDLKQAVVYTRVSSKEQRDNNLSLDFQKKTIIDYAERNDIMLVEYFGGTYESAKTDGRKEFERMLNFIKSKKGAISHILVYTTSRFSRTGGAAIKLAEDLLNKYGVQVLAVTQPTDTSTSNGQFQQNIQFLFAHWDNQQRKQAAAAGTKEKLENGIWCLKPPMGYEAIKTNGVRSIVINKTGHLLRKAFYWKLQGLKNEDILSRLRALGITIYKQKLSMLFSNPFYCGIIVNKMLDGRVIKGKHPALISESEFLEVNEIRQSAGGKFGVYHKKETDMLPLKVFIKCDKCGDGLTGYIMRARNIYYYKCRTIGCKCNINANRLNGQFLDFLEGYHLREEIIAPLQSFMEKIYHKRNQSTFEQLAELQRNLNEVQQDIDNTEESFHVKRKMGEETYMKLMPKYAKEKSRILEEMRKCQINSSNIRSYVNSAISISRELTTAWTSGAIPQKEALQKIVFPEGIYYNLENEAFRTIKVNEAFKIFTSLNKVSGDIKRKQDSINAILSSQVGATGFEPVTLCL